MLLSANAGANSIDHLADLGYEAIDIGFTAVIPGKIYDGPKHNALLDGDDWQKNLDPVIERAKERNIKIESIHLPYLYDYANPSNPAYDFELCHKMACRALQAAEYMGAKWAVMHVKDFKSTVDYAKKLFEDSGVQTVGLAIENAHSVTISTLIEVVDTLVAEGYRAGICLDVGHCHINKCYDNDVPSVIRQMGKRIKVLHIHDNSRNRDNHEAPFTGTMPWKQVMEAFKEIGFEGPFNYELKSRLIPAPAREAYEKYCVDIARYLLSIYDNYDPEAAKN